MSKCNGSMIMSNTAINQAYVGIWNSGGNLSTALESCCHAPVAQYSIDNPCMIYCNVTAPGLTTKTVQECIAKFAGNLASVTKENGTATTSTTQSPSPTGAAVSQRGLSVMGWMVFGLGVWGAVVGIV
ncbi:hypothetical protein BCR34DRAFT_595805 [Clohesyomyces aquaticus]|uniref:Uncharacterized protein n=1 Tax=Clohesyomyces aquaticus TaxID=1231657 RepID=A0A1Y2AAG4_9PLEO|nr:hypothetical protein BCR34DRAFT_595805 [Clohesyomyces aquaticus]